MITNENNVRNEGNCYKRIKNRQDNSNGNNKSNCNGNSNSNSNSNIEDNSFAPIIKDQTSPMINNNTSSMVIDHAMEFKKKYLYELISSLRGYSNKINDIKRFSDSCDTYMNTETVSSTNYNTMTTYHNNKDFIKPAINGNLFKRTTGMSASMSKNSSIMETPSKIKAVKGYLKQYEHNHETKLKIDLNGALSELKLKQIQAIEEQQSNHEFIIISLERELNNLIQSIKNSKAKYILRKKLSTIEDNMKKIIEVKKSIVDYYNAFINKQEEMSKEV